jgi:hypothetical protein
MKLTLPVVALQLGEPVLHHLAQLGAQVHPVVFVKVAVLRRSAETHTRRSGSNQ